MEAVMRVMSIAAVTIAVSGTWFAALQTHDHATPVTAAAPLAMAGHKRWAAGANQTMSNQPAFGPLRDDLCEDGVPESLARTGLEWKRALIAAPHATCGERQMRDGIAPDE
jgi:hypothetical protein